MQQHKKKWGYLFFMPYLIFCLIFSIFPIIYSAYLSLFDYSGGFKEGFIGIQNYITLFTKDPMFFKSIWVNLKLMLLYIPIVNILGLLIAVAIFNQAVKHKRLFQMANLFPYITLPVTIGLLFSMMFDWKGGIINNLLMKLGAINEEINWLGTPWMAVCIVALSIIWKNMGYYSIMYIAGLTNVPRELYEAGKVDGATSVQAFWYITLPQLKNTIMFLLITGVISGFQILEEPMMMFNSWATSGSGGNVGGPERSCFTAMWYMYDKAFGSSFDLGYASAISFGIFIFIVVFVALIKSVKRAGEKNEK